MLAQTINLQTAPKLSVIFFRDLNMKLNPTWETLKLIGKSKVVGLTSLIPFVGYLLLFNENIISYISLSREFAGAASEVSATISRLYYLYFGLTFLGISSILYLFFCPKEIKENISEYEYSNKEVNVMTHARLGSFNGKYQLILSSGTESLEELGKYFNSYANSYNTAAKNAATHELALEHAKELELHAKLDILRFHWNYVNNERYWLRCLIMSGYVAGFFLVLIPSAIVFCNVIKNISSTFP
jgi:ABC-type multidrug transport system fused ATPase/permease subunit